MLIKKQKIIKRLFDFSLSIALIFIFIIPIFFLLLLGTIDTRLLGLFTQRRIGKDAKCFTIFKVRTINKNQNISHFGMFLRKSKLDELPQLFNILIGDMSFVGPRPDLRGFADKLEGVDRVILLVKPGLTGPATIKFFNEVELIAFSDNPKEKEIEFWKEKVKLNREYVLNYYLYNDIKYLLITFKYVFKNLALKTTFKLTRKNFY